MQCQCLPSPRKDEKEGREVFDFTSKKSSAHQSSSGSGSGSKTLRRKKDHKIDLTRKGVESSSATVSSTMIKSPRRVDERSIFDFTVKKDSVTEGHYGRSNYTRRQVLDFISGKNKSTYEITICKISCICQSDNFIWHWM